MAITKEQLLIAIDDRIDTFSQLVRFSSVMSIEDVVDMLKEIRKDAEAVEAR